MGRHAAPRAQAWAALPRWRQPRPGWVALHLFFGLGMLGLAHVILAGLVILEVRAPGAGAASRNRLVSFAALGAGIALTFLGWLLFVYLRRSRVARWAWFLVLLSVGLGVNVLGQLFAEGALQV